LFFFIFPSQLLVAAATKTPLARTPSHASLPHDTQKNKQTPRCRPLGRSHEPPAPLFLFFLATWAPLFSFPRETFPSPRTAYLVSPPSRSPACDCSFLPIGWQVRKKERKGTTTRIRPNLPLAW
jgi:hypothetical protein